MRDKRSKQSRTKFHRLTSVMLEAERDRAQMRGSAGRGNQLADKLVVRVRSAACLATDHRQPDTHTPRRVHPRQGRGWPVQFRLGCGEQVNCRFESDRPARAQGTPLGMARMTPRKDGQRIRRRRGKQTRNMGKALKNAERPPLASTLLVWPARVATGPPDPIPHKKTHHPA